MKIIKIKKMMTLGVVLSILAPAAIAQNKTKISQMEVSAVALGGCVINANDLNFGTIVVEPNIQIEHNGGSFNVQCSKGVPYKIVSDAGLEDGTPVRYIKNDLTEDKLRYELFGVYPDGAKQLMLGPNNLWGGFNVSGLQNQGQQVTFGLHATIYPDDSIVSKGTYSDAISLDVIY